LKEPKKGVDTTSNSTKDLPAPKKSKAPVKKEDKGPFKRKSDEEAKELTKKAKTKEPLIKKQVKKIEEDDSSSNRHLSDSDCSFMDDVLPSKPSAKETPTVVSLYSHFNLLCRIKALRKQKRRRKYSRTQ
jgi:hypothetical protein